MIDSAPCANNDVIDAELELAGFVVCIPKVHDPDSGRFLTLDFYSSFPPAGPVISCPRNSHGWLFAIVFGHPPSFDPMPPLSSLCSRHPFILSSVFLLIFFRLVLCLRVTWGKAPTRGKAPHPSNYEFTYASGSIS